MSWSLLKNNNNKNIINHFMQLDKITYKQYIFFTNNISNNQQRKKKQPTIVNIFCNISFCCNSKIK